ncbi:MAG TPA: hypothetical protein VK155_10360 [Bacteroidales bacterium]|jgi:hypothetical protein|nr:hypothetical protein [Bacteroidales bacterium]
MISIITGDIINSRKAETRVWIKQLKDELSSFGKNPSDWEIFGGDSFELRVNDPLKALLASLRIKAAIKLLKPLDVRMAIGIGEMTYKSRKISECNGPAFIYSGDKFQTLKKEKLKIAVKSDWPDFDNIVNLCLRLGMIAMDRWSAVSAETVLMALSYPGASQEDLGRKLKIKQNTVSVRFKRAHFDDIMEINDLYQNELKKLL